MRRATIAIAPALLLLVLAVPTVRAAVPTVGAPTATNIQGVSALLEGTVDPQGLLTTHRFEYVDAAGFVNSGFAGASATPTVSAGSGTGDRLARAAVSGLVPNTTYRFRLVATNTDGSAAGEGTFTTTEGFGFRAGADGFAVSAVADGDQPATRAGSHPYQLSLSVGLKQGGEFEGQPGVPFPDGDLRGLRIGMPTGLMVNPAALPKCPSAEFHTPRSSPFAATRSGESCPSQAQVGTVEIQTSIGGGETRRFGIFNLIPSPGVPAQLGFAPYGTPVVLDVHIRAGQDGSYALTFEAQDIPQQIDLSRLELTLWGIPWGASHNGERGNCLNELEPEFPWAKCSPGVPTANPPLAYLSMPATCSDSLHFSAEASSWQQPGMVGIVASNRDSSGGTVAVGSCASVPFDPRPLGFLTTRKASSPSGFNFRLTNDNDGLTNRAKRAPSPVRKAVVRLPAGVTVNPSVGAGLGACTPVQYAAETAFSVQGAGCPNQARIGEFRMSSPLFNEWFEGAIYLARPDDPASSATGAENPFDSMVAIYLVAKLPARGMLVKVAGKVAADPTTGGLTATFEGLPQLPYSDLELNFRAGQRAFLVSPPVCGGATTQIETTPWARAGSLHTSSASPVEAGIDDGPCPTGATPPFSPDAVAGGVNANVGSYTPYFVRLSRRDTEQEITSYSLELPRGITGKLAGIPFCADAVIAAARLRRGTEESENPSCPQASQVGRTLTGYGVGPALTYAPGKVYLAGPYRGAPLSLVTINAATVGPFDLGTIVIRSAFAVDPRTAQLRIDSRASDPIPHIVEGIPLHLREVRVYIDRDQFTHNPTSCEPSEMVSTMTGSGARFGDPSDDSTAVVRRHFQLLNCLTLGFRPKLGLRLRGGSQRGDYPSLRATFASRGPMDANLKDIAVSTPRSLFLAQNHIREVCTRAQFAAEGCPPGSVYGRAVAFTPLFDEPLRGPVYLRSSSGRLPDLVTSLHAGAVQIILEGKIGPSRRGGIRAFFADVPDAPIDRFVMTLYGGRRGLLVNSSNICKAPPVASVKALGQNNLGATFTTKLRGQCKKGKGRKKADGDRRRRERQGDRR